MRRFYISRPNLLIEHKTHYRIVFEENGITIDCIPNLSEVVTILTETVTALQLLRKLGWIHRDVSIGNILSCNSRAKLEDLEYAKKMEDTASDGMPVASRIILTMPQGTMDFMFIEVASQLFLPPPPPPPLPLPHPDFDERFRLYELEESRLQEITIYPAWLVFYNEFRVTPQSNEVVSGNLLHVRRQISLAQTLFPSTTKALSRRTGFQASFQELCEELPSSKQEICSHLDALRRVVIRSYIKVEATLPNSIDLTASKDNMYEYFKKPFTLLQEQEFSLVYIPSIYNELRRCLAFLQQVTVRGNQARLFYDL
ncbi:hypothetical protein BS47DRAFT_1467753 [Hydnum rufescens UP504]|uniref:Fungal-type protein kinase domain-containing protein n=1 Tax=Hydnum rufescens UP504 TaxID=1448309 RepID=A0A9P6ATT5_9AGAM|nr:hypothetical protein BS47DRAFT_1467753 [Hydnum rufescens UP504]